MKRTSFYNIQFCKYDLTVLQFSRPSSMDLVAFFIVYLLSKKYGGSNLTMNHLSSTTSTLVNRTLTLDDWRIAIFNACQTGDLYEVIDLIDGAFTGTTAITDTRRDGQPLLMPIEVSIDFVVVRTDGPTQVRLLEVNMYLISYILS